jgi:hypothetical protein
MRNAPAPASLPPGFFPAIVTMLLLAIPLVAMQITDEVKWDATDFVVMGALLFSTGLAFEWLLRRKGSSLYRIAVGLALFSTLFMTWANLAVGLIGGEGNPVNALLLIVVVVGIAGAFLAHFRPGGMALTLTAMAGAQGVVTVLAVVLQWKELRQGPVDIWGPNGLFILLFLAAAVLFWAAAEETQPTGGAARAPGSAIPLPGAAGRALRALLLLGIGGAIGAAGIFVGAIDDAPGAGLLGCVVMVGATALAWKVWRRAH